MPVYNYGLVQGGQVIVDSKSLLAHGPLVNVEVSIPTVLANYYQQNGIRIPPPISGFALIDTGCTYTSVDDSTVRGLGLLPVGTVTGLTAGGQVVHNKYPAHVKFVGTNIEIEYNSVVSANLQGQTYNNQPIITLIGRDILAGCILIYNGLTGMYTFAH